MRYQSQLISPQPIASNAPQLFESLASKLQAFAAKEANELDREMAKKAKERGLIDAQGKTELTLRDGSTIANEAWNEGAISSHLSAIKLDISDNLTRIEAESVKDPEGYAVRAKAYSQGLLEGVPEQVRPMVQDELSSIILKSGTKIASDLRSFERDQHAATTSTAIDLYRTEGENHAKEGDILNATDAQLKAIELTTRLENSGLLTPKAAEKQRNDVTRDIEDQVIYGAFGREMANGRAMKYINNFKSLKELGDRDPEYRKKMVNTMISMMDKSHAISDAERKREDAQRKARWRNGEREVANLDLAGALIIEHLQEMVKNDQIDPKIAAKYKKAAMLDGPEFSDQIEKNLITADLLAVTEFEIQTNPALSRDDRDKLVTQRRKLEEDKANWKRTQSGTEGARRINQAFGIIAGVDTRITEDKARRAGLVLTRFYNEVEALPIEEREFKAIEVSDRLVKEVQGEINIEALDKAKDRLAKSPYQTVEQIKAADLGTEEEKTAIIQLERKLNKIERLERGQ